MDKRTILFVFALSLTLFGVSFFFQHQNAQKKQEWLKQEEIKRLNKDKRYQEEVIQRTAQVETLPLIKLYEDEQQHHFLSSGIFNDQSILTFAWTQPLPKKVFARLPYENEKKEYYLAFEPENLGSPVIYQSQADQLLKLHDLPAQGQMDLQLVDFNPRDLHSPVSVSLAEYIDGKINLLDQTKRAQLSPLLNRYSIALLKTQNGFFPVGLFNHDNQRLISIQDVQNLKPFVQLEQQKVFRTPQKVEEKFYMIETPYQQLVFSNYGGALAEINLPFESDTNALSVVREIGFDREMVKNHAYNAYFPDHPYYTSSNNNREFDFHEKGKLGGYYPLLRRDLIEQPPYTTVNVKPQYYALNILSEYPELAELVYEVKAFDDHSITFEAVQNNRKILKTYSIEKNKQKEGPYCVNLEIKIEGDSRGLWLSSGIPEVEWISGNIAPIIKYRQTRNAKAEVEKVDLPTDTINVSSINLDWICNSNGFLGMILDPLTEIESGYRAQFIEGNKVPSRLVEIDEEYGRFKAETLPGYMTLLPLKSKGGTMKFRFFAGPFDSAILKQIDQQYSDAATGYNPDYIACQTMHGWFTFISEPFAKFLFVLMNLFHSLTSSWALSIVLLTISLRIMLYPLNAWSTKSMVKMQQIAPEVSALQEKYKKDPKKAQIEVMNLYREKKVNPASGCLPLLIQMPFLIGMFDLLKSSFALRGAPFIPGWIDDLTAPDVLFSWKQPIFFFGTEFHLLPLLLGAVMFLQQRMMATGPKDPALMTEQQRQQRVMGTMMTVVFSIMFYHFPSGLNIYWLSSMLLGIAQQWYTTQQMKKEPLDVSKETPKAPLKNIRSR